MDKSGVILDSPSIILPTNALSDVQNVRFRNNAIIKMRGEVDVFGGADSFSVPQFDRDGNPIDSNGVPTATSGNAQADGPLALSNLYYWPNPRLVDQRSGFYITGSPAQQYLIRPEVNRAAGQNPIAPQLVNPTDSNGNLIPFDRNGVWDSDTFTGGFALIHNNGLDTPQYMLDEGNDDSLLLRPLPNWDYQNTGSVITGFNVSAGIVRSFGNVLIAGNLRRVVQQWDMGDAYTFNANTETAVFNNGFVFTLLRDASAGQMPGDSAITVPPGGTPTATSIWQRTNRSRITNLTGTIRVSDPAAPGQIPMNWDPFAAGSTFAEERELTDTSEVRNIQPLQGQAIIYTSDSIHALALGANNIVTSQVASGWGTLNANSVIEFDGKHFVVDVDDIYLFQGHPGNIKSVADARVRDYLYNNLHPVSVNNTHVVLNKSQDEIWVNFPNRRSINGFCNEALIWNYRSNTWTRRELNDVVQSVSGPVNGGGLPQQQFSFDGSNQTGHVIELDGNQHTGSFTFANSAFTTEGTEPDSYDLTFAGNTAGLLYMPPAVALGGALGTREEQATRVVTSNNVSSNTTGTETSVGPAGDVVVDITDLPEVNTFSSGPQTPAVDANTGVVTRYVSPANNGDYDVLPVSVNDSQTSRDAMFENIEVSSTETTIQSIFQEFPNTPGTYSPTDVNPRLNYGTGISFFPKREQDSAVVVTTEGATLGPAVTEVNGQDGVIQEYTHNPGSNGTASYRFDTTRQVTSSQNFNNTVNRSIAASHVSDDTSITMGTDFGLSFGAAERRSGSNNGFTYNEFATTTNPFGRTGQVFQNQMLSPTYTLGNATATGAGRVTATIEMEGTTNQSIGVNMRVFLVTGNTTLGSTYFNTINITSPQPAPPAFASGSTITDLGTFNGSGNGSTWSVSATISNQAVSGLGAGGTFKLYAWCWAPFGQGGTATRGLGDASINATINSARSITTTETVTGATQTINLSGGARNNTTTPNSGQVITVSGSGTFVPLGTTGGVTRSGRTYTGQSSSVSGPTNRTLTGGRVPNNLDAAHTNPSSGNAFWGNIASGYIVRSADAETDRAQTPTLSGGALFGTQTTIQAQDAIQNFNNNSDDQLAFTITNNNDADITSVRFTPTGTATGTGSSIGFYVGDMQASPTTSASGSGINIGTIASGDTVNVRAVLNVGATTVNDRNNTATATGSNIRGFRSIPGYTYQVTNNNGVEASVTINQSDATNTRTIAAGATVNDFFQAPNNNVTRFDVATSDYEVTVGRALYDFQVFNRSTTTSAVINIQSPQLRTDADGNPLTLSGRAVLSQAGANPTMETIEVRSETPNFTAFYKTPDVTNGDIATITNNGNEDFTLTDLTHTIQTSGSGQSTINLRRPTPAIIPPLRTTDNGTPTLGHILDENITLTTRETEVGRAAAGAGVGTTSVTGIHRTSPSTSSTVRVAVGSSVSRFAISSSESPLITLDTEQTPAEVAMAVADELNADMDFTGPNGGFESITASGPTVTFVPKASARANFTIQPTIVDGSPQAVGHIPLTATVTEEIPAGANPADRSTTVQFTFEATAQRDDPNNRVRIRPDGSLLDGGTLRELEPFTVIHSFTFGTTANGNELAAAAFESLNQDIDIPFDFQYTAGTNVINFESRSLVDDPNTPEPERETPENRPYTISFDVTEAGVANFQGNNVTITNSVAGLPDIQVGEATTIDVFLGDNLLETLVFDARTRPADPRITPANNSDVIQEIIRVLMENAGSEFTVDFDDNDIFVRLANLETENPEAVRIEVRNIPSDPANPGIVNQGSQGSGTRASFSHTDVNFVLTVSGNDEIFNNERPWPTDELNEARTFVVMAQPTRNTLSAADIGYTFPDLQDPALTRNYNSFFERTQLNISEAIDESDTVNIESFYIQANAP